MPTRMRQLPRPGQLFRDNRSIFLSFLFPMLIISATFFSRGVFPFGDRNILTIDLYHQYAPFVVELREKLTSLSSLFYTWNGGLGTNFWSLFAYYLASPLNAIVVLFPARFITEAILVLVVIKLGLAGATFAAFLRGVHRIEGAAAVAFGTMYALSGYTIAYFWNIMWLESLFLLPLVLLGLHRMIRERRFLLYTVSLALVIYTNYYMAFFICLFTVLYYPVALFSEPESPRAGQVFGATVRFGAFSLLAGGLAAVLLLPTYISLRLTSAAGDRFPSTVTHAHDLFDFIGQHYVLTPPSIREGMPNMYAGLAVLILLPVYFLCRAIPLRAKLWHIGLVAVMILSFNINVLNFVWHGMHFPNQLPYRNSFVYIFLILSMAAPAFAHLREFSGKQIGAIGAYLALLILLSQKLNAKKPELVTLYVTLGFLIVYLAVFTADRVLHMTRRELALAFLLVVLAEMTLNTFLMIHRVDTTEYLSTRNGYLSGKEVAQIREQLASIEERDDSFYRVEILNPRTINDGFLYSFRGLSIFASTVPTKPVRLFENLGFHSNSINSYKYEGSTILLNAIFNIRYLIHRDQKVDDRLHQMFAATDELMVYENPYAAGIGYWTPAAIEQWNSFSGSPFDAQNALLSGIVGGGSALMPIDVAPGETTNLTFSGTPYQTFSFRRENRDQESVARVTVGNLEDQQVYLYLDIPANVADYGFVSIGDRRVDFNAKRATIIDLGHVLASEPITLEIHYKSTSPDNSSFDLFACGLAADTMQNASDQLRRQAINVSRFTDTRIEGSVLAPTDGRVLMTIPYDKGWKVQVDGEEVPVKTLDEGLIMFDVTAGQHDIVMDFRPSMLFEGALISLASLIILLAMVQITQRRERARVAAGYVPAGMRPVPQRVDAELPPHQVFDGADTDLGPGSEPDETGAEIDSGSEPDEADVDLGPGAEPDEAGADPGPGAEPDEAGADPGPGDEPDGK